MIVSRRVCVPLADFFDEAALSQSRVFERLVEVKLLSTARRRERTDERPLHHPNGIHKALNQPCCLGFGWEKGSEAENWMKAERNVEHGGPQARSEDHTERTHERAGQRMQTQESAGA